MSFDFAQDIRQGPIVVSLSNHELSTNGLCDSIGLEEIMEEHVFLIMDSLVTVRFRRYAMRYALCAMLFSK